MYNSIFHLKWESSIQCKETLKVTRTAGPEISFPRRSEANPSLKKLYQKKPQTLTGSPKRPLKMSWRNLFPPGQVSKKERKGKHKKIQSVWNSFHNEKKIRFWRLNSEYLLAVSNVYEGDFKITNVGWDNRLKDRSSNMYREMAGKLEVALDEMLITSNLRNEAVFFVRVTNFSSTNSVIPQFRISWMPKSDPSYQVSRDALMRRFQQELQLEEQLLAGIYEVEDRSLGLRCKYKEGFGKKEATVKYIYRMYNA